jgi:hypothetical protein
VVDTIRELGALQTILADNGAGAISAQDIRDFLVSVKGGFGYYADLATKTTPIVVTSGVRTKITSDHLGVESNTDHLPYPKTKVTDELWDVANDRVDLANLPEGTRLTVRLDFTVTPASPNTGLDLFAVFHDSLDVFAFELDYSMAQIKSAAAHGEVVEVDFFVGTNNTDGFVYFELLTDSNCDVEVGGIYISVKR